MMWVVEWCTSAEAAGSRDVSDHGGWAYRAVHGGTRCAVPVPFARKADCSAATAILNKEMPLDGLGTREEIRGAFLARYGSRQQLIRYLVERCCAW